MNKSDDARVCSARDRPTWRCVWCLAVMLLLPYAVGAQGASEEDNFIDPTRPSVSESATIQRAGVLQFEPGQDADFRAPNFRSQTAAPLAVRFAATNWLRLDLDVDAFVSQVDHTGARVTGVGDTSLGFKLLARTQPKQRLALAFSYAIKLPSADAEKNLGTNRVDHNLRLILNRTFGKTDYRVNLSYLNVGREDSPRRASGAQVIFTVVRELPRDFGVIGEVYGQSVDEQQPRGVYTLGAVTYQINGRLRCDVGLRGGFGSDAPRVGVFAGLTIGVADLYRKR